MSKSYSMDLRSRVVAAVASGSSRRQAARRFGVSPSCAVKLLARVQATGSPEPGRRGRRPGSGKLGPFEAVVIAWVEEKPERGDGFAADWPHRHTLCNPLQRLERCPSAYWRRLPPGSSRSGC